MATTQLDDRDDGRWIRLAGELDHVGCLEVEPAFTEAVRDAAGPVVVDMAGVTFVASPGIKMLLEAHRALRDKGRPLKLSALSPRIHRTFETVGVFHVIEEHEG